MENNNIIDDLKREIEQLKSRVVELEGWKGKDEIEINKVDSGWEIIEHRKDKETGEIHENKHTITHDSVVVVWEKIKSLCPKVGQETKYRDIVPLLITHYGWTDVDMESFNGGRNRSKYYFKYLYYPLKVLERNRLIEYGGTGTMKRIFDY